MSALEPSPQKRHGEMSAKGPKNGHCAIACVGWLWCCQAAI